MLTTGISRPLLASTLFVPSAISYLLERRGLIPRGRAGQIILELALCSLGLYSGLMLMISFFPETMELPVSAVEPEFHNLRSEDGKPIDNILFNKGL